ncbi:MAG: hypothetical protein J6W52_06210 [Bacteroidaceae bacterium]|nr:hypothetical protein [Bacteroidaceae bacterium]
MKNWFFRFLTSGFGTDMAALKALGWVIAISLIGLWVFIWIVKKIYKAIVGEKVPNLKSGPYAVQIDAVGATPKKLKKQLCEFKGYSSSLANKVMKTVPSIAFTGCSEEDADDVKVVLEEMGATCSIVTPAAK